MSQDAAAAHLMTKLDGLMADADDFAPDDNVARNRSLAAKAHYNKADAAFKKRKWKETLKEAQIAIDYLEGNR